MFHYIKLVLMQMKHLTRKKKKKYIKWTETLMKHFFFIKNSLTVQILIIEKVQPIY